MVGRADLGDNDRGAVIQYIKTFSSRFENERLGKPINVPPAPPKTKEVVAQGRGVYE